MLGLFHLFSVYSSDGWKIKTVISLQYEHDHNSWTGGRQPISIKTIIELLLELENLEEVSRTVIGDDEVFVDVDRDAFRDVDIVGDDVIEGVADARPIAAAVHHDATVALVGDDEVEGAVEADAPRLVELAFPVTALLATKSTTFIEVLTKVTSS